MKRSTTLVRGTGIRGRRSSCRCGDPHLTPPDDLASIHRVGRGLEWVATPKCPVVVGEWDFLTITFGHDGSVGEFR